MHDQLLIPRAGVVEDGHTIGTDHRQLLLLERIQPAHEHVRANAAGKAHRGQSCVGHAVGEVRIPRADDPLRDLTPGQGQDDGDVVRSETPEGVFLAANLAQVQPVRGDVVQLAHVPGRQHGLELLNARMILQQVPHHQHQALLRRERH